MIITVTGTPGTGKTSVSKKLGYPVIGITEFAERNNIGEMDGEEREIDIDELIEALKHEVSEYEDIVIEGHLAHHYPSDYCVVLRCRPDIVRKRLSERDYSDQKVEENVEAEAMDLILSEAAQSQENIIEVDTSERDVDEVAEEVKERIGNDDTGFGSINWMEYL